MKMTEEARTLLFTKMYTSISKATAEGKDLKGNTEKTVFRGPVKCLFEGINPSTITKFLWAVSHKTESLRTQLFKITDLGHNGYEIERVHTGFVSNETGKKIVGTELVPYIIEATKLYRATPRKPKPVEAPVAIEPVAISYAGNPVKPEQLSDREIDLGIKEYTLSLQLLQQEKEKRAAIKAKKAELFKVFSEMAQDEGFSLEDILEVI